MNLLFLHARCIVRVNRSQKVHIIVGMKTHDILVIGKRRFLVKNRKQFLQTCPFLCRDHKPAADDGQYVRDVATMNVPPKHYFPTMMFSITVVSNLRYRIKKHKKIILS